jgi:hypothetical protein
MGCSSGPDIVEDGLVLCLDAGSKRSYPGTGTTWTDTVGGNDGTLNNITYSSANGGEFVLDGTNDYIDISSSANLIPNGTDFSLCFWAYSDFANTTSYPRLFSTGNYDYLEIAILSKTNLWMYKRNDGAWSQKSAALNASSYNNIIYVRDGNVDRFYINNSLVNTSSSNTHPYSANINLYRIGARYTSGYPQDNLTYGVVSSFLSYNRALTADEVRRNYLSTKERYQ